MIPDIILAVVIVVAVLYDLKERRIPNWVTIPGIVAGLALQTARFGSQGLIAALLGAAAGAALLAIPFVIGWVGGGDLKLVAAIGAIMGAPFALWALLFASAIGGIIAAVWLAYTGTLVSSVVYIFTSWRKKSQAKPAALAATISFGPALALGTLVARFL